ncbi:MAG: ABC transporter permease [Candidatus Brocadiia bacterium]
MRHLRWLFLATRRGYWRKTVGIFSIACAVCLLTWTIGLTTSTLYQYQPSVGDVTDIYDLWVLPKMPAAPKQGMGAGFQEAPGAQRGPMFVSDEVVEAVRKSGLVEKCEPLACTPVQVDYAPNGIPLSGPRPRAMLAPSVPNNGHYAQKTLDGRWPDDASTTPEVVFSAAGFYVAPPKIGGTVGIVTRSGRFEVKTVGLLRLNRFVEGFPTMFVNKAAADLLLPKGRALTSIVLCRKKPGVTLEAMRQAMEASGIRIGEGIALSDPVAAVQSLADMQWEMFAGDAPLKFGLALAFMLCMVFTTLYTGLQQKRLMYMRLRSVGMSRLQLAFSVVYEALMMGALGAVVGILAGFVILKLYVMGDPKTFPLGVYIGPVWVTLIAASSLIAVLLASAWPCIKVLRMRPMDFIDPGVAPDARLPWRRIVAGLLMTLPCIALAMPLPITPAMRTGLMTFVGLPLLGIGVIFSAPFWCWLIDAGVADFVSRLLGLHPSLLRHQIRRDLNRTIGVMVTLAVGLGLYMAIEIWGGSMLKPFLPDPTFPDMVVSCLPDGLDAQSVAKMASAPGVRKDRFMALEVDQFILDDETLHKLEQNVQYDLWQNNIILVGLDPKQGFAGADPMLPFRFREGVASSCADALASGSSCVIPETLATHAGLSVGDTVKLRIPVGKLGRPGGKESPAGPTERTESLKVAGIVDLNWHLYTSRANMRGRNGKPHRTLGPVFVSTEVARKLTGNSDRTRFLWFDISDDLRDSDPLAAAGKMNDTFSGLVDVKGSDLVVKHRDRINDETIDHARMIIGSMSRVPFWSLIILSLAMLNLLVATVVERRRELSMMRSVGLTRGQFGRLLLGEVILIWGAGVLFSFAFGVCAGWATTGWTRAVLPFGGIPLAFEVPWGRIFLSIGISLSASLLVSAIPIAWIIRGKPGEMMKVE